MAEPRPRPRQTIGWVLYALVEAPIVAAVAVGLAAPYLSPRVFWWSQLVAIGLPYATWALAATTLPWLLGRRWRVVAVHALLLLAVVWRAGGPSRLATPEAGPDDLVLTTFNLPQSGPSAEALGDSVVAYLEATEPDLLLMQDARVEARSVRRRRASEAVQVEVVHTRLPYNLVLPAQLAGRRSGTANATDVPFFVRHGAGIEVLEQRALAVGAEPGLDASLALRTHLRWDGREAVVYNIHLRSFGSPKPWDDPAVSLWSPSTWRPYLRSYRTVYAQRGIETDRIARAIAEETLPVIIGGDLNSTADNWSYRRLRTAGGVNRIDAAQAVGPGWGRTYRADRPLVRIDFLLVDPAFEVTSAETAAVGFSDHRPVRTTLRWREADPAGATPEADTDEE
ncbi:endonuclease/exonuclease/phosphatase family protein [Rubrivirga sp. IMCC43871]|uniref:endonuclease/exonuclease/phosphatase family protein n=1 Tax=Rubrivirga sp. IMCC43871 TaxID=3391575 RepID=UPI003990021F